MNFFVYFSTMFAKLNPHVFKKSPHLPRSEDRCFLGTGYWKSEHIWEIS